MIYSGVLTIKPISMTTTRSTDFGKSDPYLKMKVGEKELRTKVYEDGGNDITFEEEFDEFVENIYNFMVTVKDKDVFGSDFIASAMVPLQDALNYGSAREEVILYYEGEDVGRIVFDLKMQIKEV